MTDIDTLSGEELDALAATSVMGWHFGERTTTRDTPKSLPAWRYANEDLGAYSGDWNPSGGTVLNYAANTVLLKALGDGLLVTIRGAGTKTDPFFVEVRGKTTPANYRPLVAEALAPTLPLALARAICKAVAKQEQDKATLALARAIREDREANDGK